MAHVTSHEFDTIIQLLTEQYGLSSHARPSAEGQRLSLPQTSRALAAPRQSTLPAQRRATARPPRPLCPRDALAGDDLRV